MTETGLGGGVLWRNRRYTKFLRANAIKRRQRWGTEREREEESEIKRVVWAKTDRGKTKEGSRCLAGASKLECFKNSTSHFPLTFSFSGPLNAHQLLQGGLLLMWYAGVTYEMTVIFVRSLQLLIGNRSPGERWGLERSAAFQHWTTCLSFCRVSRRRDSKNRRTTILAASNQLHN